MPNKQKTQKQSQARRKVKARRQPAPGAAGVKLLLERERERVGTHGALPVAIAKYLESLDDPERAFGVKVPLQVNNIPSHDSIVARTRDTTGLTVAPGASAEILLFPGHAASDESNALDLVSAHANVQNIGGATYNIGPIDDDLSTGYASGLFTVSGTSAGVVKTTSAASVFPIITTSLPYVAKANEGHHSRWRLVSMCIVVKNKTQALSRGGVFFSVQPDNKWLPEGTANAAGWSPDRVEFQNFDSYREHKSDNYLKINWIPRPEDLSFWHTQIPSGTDTGTSAAAIRIWFDNYTSTAQGLEFTVTQNWELAGASLRAVSTPAVDHPKSGAIIKPVIETAHNALPSAKHMSKLGRFFHAAIDTGAQMFETARHFHKEHSEILDIVGLGALAPAMLPETLAKTAAETLGEDALAMAANVVRKVL